MSDQLTGALIGLAVYFGMKLIDRTLPPDTHFRCIERWLTKDKKEDTDGSET